MVVVRANELAIPQQTCCNHFTDKTFPTEEFVVTLEHLFTVRILYIYKQAMNMNVCGIVNKIHKCIFILLCQRLLLLQKIKDK